MRRHVDSDVLLVGIVSHLCIETVSDHVAQTGINAHLDRNALVSASVAKSRKELLLLRTRIFMQNPTVMLRASRLWQQPRDSGP